MKTKKSSPNIKIKLHDLDDWKEGWLSGWKSISNFFQVCVDTAKKYEREYGLPIRRDPGGGPVLIKKDALDWMTKVNTRKTACIYFIQCEDNGLIKIGFSNDIEKRFNSLRTQSPARLKLLKHMEGGVELEAKLHNKFKKYRHHGEWFEPSKEILRYIERV